MCVCSVPASTGEVDEEGVETRLGGLVPMTGKQKTAKSKPAPKVPAKRKLEQDAAVQPPVTSSGSGVCWCQLCGKSCEEPSLAM